MPPSTVRSLLTRALNAGSKALGACCGQSRSTNSSRVVWRLRFLTRYARPAGPGDVGTAQLGPRLQAMSGRARRSGRSAAPRQSFAKTCWLVSGSNLIRRPETHDRDNYDPRPSQGGRLVDEEDP